VQKGLAGQAQPRCVATTAASSSSASATIEFPAARPGRYGALVVNPGGTERILARNGYHVITAANGPEGLDIARGHPGEIHLLITDAVMPHMLGKEVAEKIRAIKPDRGALHARLRSSYPASQGRLEPMWPSWKSRSPRPTCWPRPDRYLMATSGFETIKGSPD
jgi:hypothetical protein